MSENEYKYSFNVQYNSAREIEDKRAMFIAFLTNSSLSNRKDGI